jgi:hypothetical protein
MSEQVLQAITESRPKPVTVNADVVNNWFWKFVPVDPLVFQPPQHEGGTLQIAREVYHRMLARMISDKAHRMQTGILIVAWVLTLILGQQLQFRGADTLGWLLGLATFGAFLFVAVPILMRLACPASSTAEATGIVRRTFLRDLPAETPRDLRDDLQQGWLTVQGRPLSSELSAEDGRTTEATRRSSWWIITAFAAAWAVAYLFETPPQSAGRGAAKGAEMARELRELQEMQRAMQGMGGMGAGGMVMGAAALSSLLGSWMVLLILAIKLIFDKRPLQLRATELDEAEAVEGTAYIAAGGQPWGAIPEAARQRQIQEAARDRSPLIELGMTTGVFAGRGDFFGPSAGLPFCVSLKDLQMHMLVLGGTGSGKTSGALRPLARQLSDHNNVGLVIMDGKGALPGELRDLPRMQVIDPGQRGVAVSLVSGVEPAVIVDTMREILAPAGAGGQDPFWINSAAGALRRGAVIAQAAGGDWWSLLNAAHIVSNKADREQIINALMPKADQDPLLKEAFMYFRQEWDVMDPKTSSNILATLRSWLSTITATPELLRWARTPAGKDTIDLMAPLKGGRIGFLMPEHRYGVAGAVVSALLKARLYSGLKDRAERRWEGGEETPVVFIIDEAQEVATSQDAQMLPIGRSLGLATVAATQGVEGINAKLGETIAPKWLSIFGSVVALSGRSPPTDEFVSARAGESWQLTPLDIDGNTVRTSLSVEVLAGATAASRTQPHMAAIVSKSGWLGLPGRLFTAMRGRSSVKARRAAAAPGKAGHLTLGPRALVAGGEIASLVAIPDTAVAIATRGRVPRRDVIRLKPEYPGEQRQAAVADRAAVPEPAKQPAQAQRSTETATG